MYYSNNEITCIYIYTFCYIQFYIMFQHITHRACGTGSGGSGLIIGQGHPSWQLVSSWCLQFDILHFLLFDDSR